MPRSKKRPSRPQLQLVEPVEGVAFDEMNLVELPFALLTDAKQIHRERIGRLPLNATGEERLVSNEGENLPTALAERVVLALLWMTMRQNGFKEPTIRFPLRSLIQDYMYPDRSPGNRVAGAFFKRVEEEIRRVAHTRIVSSRWFDKELKKVTHMDASIIDYIQVIEEGGRNKARILEIRWGAKLFKSIRDRYTKSIDVRTVLRIDRPLDLRFYRWLDRQLGVKDREVVASCQNFARYKLLMRGQKIERGGRTASSYIVTKLSESLERLDGIGFKVRLTVDKSQEDYRLVFDRIRGDQNETVTEDSAGELVREFQRLSYGRDASRKRRIAAADREAAEQWLEDYGAEDAYWLVQRCIALHKRSSRKDDTLYRFKALAFYEDKAVADLANHQEEQLKLNLGDRREDAWKAYREEQVALGRKKLGKRGLAELERAVKDGLEAQYASSQFKPPKKVFDSLVRKGCEAQTLSKIGAMTEQEFMSAWVEDAEQAV